ncbi:hypothetical protein [Empedobacter brevis]|uniref:hypothetical protein n=1 Tax=Empedobacter brevis TaxID=247 RepID=UPI0039B03A85
MSENSSNIDNSEIDLDIYAKKINNSIKKSIKSFFSFLSFIKRNLAFLIPLFILLAYLGYFIDKKNTKYTSELYIKANFDNVEYLYSKIKSLNSKIITKDSNYFKQNKLLLNNIYNIKITPIEDPFNFISSRNDKSFDLLKLFAEENNIEKVISDKNFYKNYNNHVISIESVTPIDFRLTYKRILDNLNNNDYYTNNMSIQLKNINEKIIYNNEMISQIDKIISKNSSENNSKSKESVVMIGENSELSALLEMKNQLIKENQEYNVDLINKTSIFKVISDDIENIRVKENFFIYLLPFLGVFIYLFIAFIFKLRSKFN